MSIFQGFRPNIDYPLFVVNVVLGTSPTATTGSFAYVITRYPATLNPTQTTAVTDVEPAFLAAAKQFFQNYDYTADFGAGVSAQSVTISECVESQTDVTPA